MARYTVDESEQVKSLLAKAADLAGDRLDPPSADEFARRRVGRRRAAFSVAAAVCAVLVVALSVVALSRGHRAPPSTGRDAATGPGSAAELARGRWSVLPAAPIDGRSGAAGAWTGSQMLVWGGASGARNRQLNSTGAAYDPASRRWALLPTGPLSARTQTASVWTGRELFVWGGYTAADDSSQATDGALYNPTTKTWRSLPAAPVTGWGQAHVVWTGSRVILLSTPPSDNPASVRVDAYDPATNRWTALPELTLPARHPLVELVSLAADSRVYVWSEWAYTVTRGNTSTSQAGIDAFTLDPAAGTWTSNKLLPPDRQAVRDPLWTGHEILVPGLRSWCPGCRGPGAFNVTGVLINPHDTSTQPVPHGPVDDLTPRYLWTGKSLLAYDSGTFTTAGGTTYPGAAAVWDPRTRAWTRLPGAPMSSSTPGESLAVWTGTHLLIWGQLATTSHDGSTRHGPTNITTQTAGLQFGS
jgi:hypothetical protein